MKKTLLVAAVAAAVIACRNPVFAQSFLWGQQFGTDGEDTIRDIAADDVENVLYVGGVTGGSLGGPRIGTYDSFISKLNPSTGETLWIRQFGVSDIDAQIYGIAADGAGSVYVTGETYGSLVGPSAGGNDVFLSKYDSKGTLQWARQIGTSDFDRSVGVAADGLGNVFIAGYTRGKLGARLLGGVDAFVSKYDAAGNQIWLNQFGTPFDDVLTGIDADSRGSFYVTGKTGGSFASSRVGGDDGIVVKFDDAGNTLWARQFGSTASEEPTSVAVDPSGSPVIVGITRGNLAGPFAGGIFDGFVKKYDSSGNGLWTHQFGTTANDIARDVAVSSRGIVFVAGSTEGSLAGTNPGGFDAIHLALNAQGSRFWTQQVSTTDYDNLAAVAVNDMGRVYFGGETGGALYSSPNFGSRDAFITSFAEVPEPSALSSLAVGLAALDWKRRRARLISCSES